MADGEDAETDEKTDVGEGETRAATGPETGAEDGEGLTDANGEDDIPPAPLWAMRTRMHSLRRLEPGDEDRESDAGDKREGHHNVKRKAVGDAVHDELLISGDRGYTTTRLPSFLRDFCA